MSEFRGAIWGVRWLLVPLILLSACQGVPSPSPGTGQETLNSTAPPSPTATEVAPPQPTFDAGVQPYLEDVEDILRHSAVVIKDRALGIPDACPDLYITAFPYSEPDRTGGQTLAVTALTREDDGSIILGEHRYLWNLKGEGVDPERCKQVYIQDRSEPGLIRIVFQVQDPYDSSWRIGVASGICPSLELAGYFYLEHPDDFQLLITTYAQGEPTDFWLRDGSQLLRYHWEPWQETLLWTINDVPGSISDLKWDNTSQDINGDGLPDLAITWNISGNQETRYYSPAANGFILLENGSAGD